MPVGRRGLENIQTSMPEIRKLLEELNARKAAGSDSVSSWVMKECSQQVAGKLSDLINASLSQGSDGSGR